MGDIVGAAQLAGSLFGVRGLKLCPQDEAEGEAEEVEEKADAFSHPWAM